MTSRTPSEPPDEPLNIAEPQVLSPASPKPIHFPAPSNIPVLEMQMDVGFNQTELHMNDPAMRNTATRPNMWRDPNEKEQGEGQMAVESDSVGGQGVSQATQHVNVEESIRGDEPNHVVLGNIAPLANGQSVDQNSHVSHNPQALSTEQGDVHSAESTGVRGQLGDCEDPEPASSTAASGSSDIQALFSRLGQPAPGAQPAVVPTIESSPSITQSLVPPPTGLPPRPPPQDPSRAQPHSNLSQSIRDFHPHPSLPALQALSAKDGSSENARDATQHQRPPSILSPSSAKSHVSNSLPNVLQSPFGTNFPPGLSDTPVEARRGDGVQYGHRSTASNGGSWNADIQRKYDHFVEEERRYVEEGRWEQFPQGSRLFVGNLSSDKVSKREVFLVFHKYGELAQISLKQAYGFVQYLRPEDCVRALQNEEGTQLGEKRIHLEVSKPQKNRPAQPAQRRSRSPDGRGNRNTADRYNGRDQAQNRGYRHDSYGPRSPSPPRGGYGDRRYDGYRSRSPDRGFGRNRGYRSPSPRRAGEEDLPLPRRAPHEIPDIQILVVDHVDRDFIAWVERAFTARGLQSHALALSRRLPEAAVVRRQIVEGVVAVSRLTRRNQDTGKIGLQIFDRSRGANNVRFEEYGDLDPTIATELVIRAKQTKVSPSYGSQYGTSPSYPPHTGYPVAGPPVQHTYAQPAPQSTAPPNLQNLITSLDTSSLQNLLSAMNQPSPTTPQHQYGAPPPGPVHPQQRAAVAALQQNPNALAGLMQQQQQQTAPQVYGQPPATAPSASGTAPAVNMQEILARLGTYKA